MLKKLITILILSSITLVTYGKSPVVSLETLVQRLLQVNYTIDKADKRSAISQNNVTLAQFLPTAGVDIYQSQRDGSNHPTNTVGGGVKVGWRLFDGLAMFALYEGQKQNYDLSLLNKREIVENLASNLTTQYYLIISLESRLRVAQESMQLSEIRYNEARLKYQIGAASGLEKELAKTDYNADSSNLIKQREALDIAYITLNGMLLFDPAEREYIQDTIIMSELFDKDDLAQMTAMQNVQLCSARLGADMSDIDLKLARAERYPTLDFAAGYNYAATDLTAPQGALGWSPGYNWGFTIGVNLFNGMETTRKIRNAKLEQQIATITVDEVETAVATQLNKQWANYISNLKQINFETENTAAMRFNLETAMKRYRLGDLSGIDLRIIQQQYLDAVDRKINVIYQAKASEIQLLTLAGALI